MLCACLQAEVCALCACLYAEGTMKHPIYGRLGQNGSAVRLCMN